METIAKKSAAELLSKVIGKSVYTTDKGNGATGLNLVLCVDEDVVNEHEDGVVLSFDDIDNTEIEELKEAIYKLGDDLSDYSVIVREYDNGYIKYIAVCNG